MMDWLASFFLLAGASFMLLAAIGVVRMPDLYSRLQTTTKAVTLGAGSLLVAVALFFGTISIVTRAVLVIAFLVLTVPISAHMISRAAYIVRVPLWEGTVVDELGDDLREHLIGGEKPRSIAEPGDDASSGSEGTSSQP